MRIPLHHNFKDATAGVPLHSSCQPILSQNFLLYTVEQKLKDKDNVLNCTYGKIQK